MTRRPGTCTVEAFHGTGFGAVAHRQRGHSAPVTVKAPPRPTVSGLTLSEVTSFGLQAKDRRDPPGADQVEGTAICAVRSTRRHRSRR